MKDVLNTGNKKQRDSQFELLRIISMMMIVAHHAFGHNASWNLISQDTSIAMRLTSIFFWSIGGIGVNLFILVSAWFLSRQNSLRIKSLIHLLAEASIISVVMYMIGVFVFKSQFSLVSFLRRFYPNGLWFVKTYFLFALIAPFLSQMLKSLTKKDHQCLICVLTGIWFFWPEAFGARSATLHMLNVCWFLYCMIILSYLRNYPIRWLSCQRRVICFAIIMAVLSVCFSYFVYPPYDVQSNLGKLSCLPYVGYWIRAVLAVVIFLIFRNMKSFTSIIINLLGSATYGVYLIHETNPLQDYLWKNICVLNVGSGISVFLQVVVITIFVFFGCSIFSILYSISVKRCLSKIMQLLFRDIK